MAKAGDWIDKMIDALLEEIDSDIAKEYHEETAEDPDGVQDSRNVLRSLVMRHIPSSDNG